MVFPCVTPGSPCTEECWTIVCDEASLGADTIGQAVDGGGSTAVPFATRHVANYCTRSGVDRLFQCSQCKEMACVRSARRYKCFFTSTLSVRGNSPATALFQSAQAVFRSFILLLKYLIPASPREMREKAAKRSGACCSGPARLHFSSNACS
jgi:hypothetical protein